MCWMSELAAYSSSSKFVDPCAASQPEEYLKADSRIDIDRSCDNGHDMCLGGATVESDGDLQELLTSDFCRLVDA